MKYFKKFKNNNHYESYVNNNVVILPNISLISSNKSMHYTEKKYDARIEYLESTGSQYIKLPFSREYSVEVDFSFTNTSTAQQRIFSSSNGGNITLYLNNNLKVAYARFSDWLSTNYGPAINEIIKFEYYRDTGEVYLNGTLKSTYNNKDEITGNTFNLFCNNIGEGGFLYGRIYSVKLYNEDRTKLLYDYIPVVKNGIGYLYDNINRKLYGNLGIGEPFVLGNTIDRMSKKYIPLEYIESTGTQYIYFSDVYDEYSVNDFWDVNSIYKFNIRFYESFYSQVNQAAIFTMSNDYGPTLYRNGSNGMYWKFSTSSLSNFEHVSPGTLSDRQIKIVSDNKIIRTEIEYKCINCYMNNDSSPGLLYPSLFCRSSSGDPDRKIRSKLYSFEMYKNNELVLKCIPCKTKSGEIGLYETVHQKFLKSPNNEPFVAGPIITYQ